jgi:hypothetical protein
LILNYSNLTKITFPVYKIPNSNWELVDGLLFLDNEVLDDRNQKGKTLGIRRAQTSFDLFPLKHSIASLTGILKQNDKTFIDTKGTPFIYQKTRNSALKYYKIRKVEQKGVVSILWLKDIKSPFTIPRPPPLGMTWAGVLHIESWPWILYCYSETYQKPTRRKI